MNGLGGWFNAMVSAPAVKSASADGLLEGTLDLTAVFGSVPQTIYVAAAAYATADGGNLVAQVPLGNGDGNIDPAEFLPLSIAALKDENDDGIYDRLQPTVDFVVTQISQAGGIVTLSWATVPGRTYQVESSDGLSGTWSPLNAPITAGQGQLTLSATDSPMGSSRFYRVRLLNP